MKNLLMSILLTFLNTFTSHIILYIYMMALISSKMQWKKIAKIVFPLSAVTTGIMFLDAYVLNGIGGILLSIYGVLCINIVAVYLTFEKNIYKSIVIVCLSGILQVGTGILTASITLYSGINGIEQVVVVFPLYFAFAFIIRTVIMQLHIGNNLHYLITQSKRPWVMALVAIILENLCEVFYYTKDKMQDNFLLTYSVTTIMLLLIIFLILVYFSVTGEKDAKIKAQDAVLMQQKLYIDSLESMQLEMRTFRHDYKNMLSGMYLYAQEGEVLALQNTIQKMTVNFDNKVGENIRQTTQMGNIRSLELKSLVLTKLMQMNEQKIKCNLEVLYPVEKIGMERMDLNRCLGILLDNAIEAAGESENPVIDLVISSQEECLTIIVRNSVNGKVELHKIWNRGYSTKGKNRGLGLSSYQAILEKYTNVTPITNFYDQEFEQELKIACGR